MIWKIKVKHLEFFYVNYFKWSFDYFIEIKENFYYDNRGMRLFKLNYYLCLYGLWPSLTQADLISELRQITVDGQSFEFFILRICFSKTRRTKSRSESRGSCWWGKQKQFGKCFVEVQHVQSCTMLLKRRIGLYNCKSDTVVRCQVGAGEVMLETLLLG